MISTLQKDTESAVYSRSMVACIWSLNDSDFYNDFITVSRGILQQVRFIL